MERKLVREVVGILRGYTMMAQQYEAVTHAVLSCRICISGFHYDIYNGTFGVYRKGVYVPQSNFVFEFTTGLSVKPIHKALVL